MHMVFLSSFQAKVCSQRFLGDTVLYVDDKDLDSVKNSLRMLTLSVIGCMKMNR